MVSHCYVVYTYMHSLITNSSPHVGGSNDTMHVSSVTMELHPRIGIGYPYNITVITSLGIITIVDMDTLPA